MRVNEIYLKISGKFPIEPEEFEMGQDLDLKVSGSIVKKEIGDNQDGSVNITYVIKPVSMGVEN